MTRGRPASSPNCTIRTPVPPQKRAYRDHLSFDAPEQIGRFVFHCHILKHEDNGLTALIEVCSLTPGWLMRGCQREEVGMEASHVAALLAISCLGGITAFPDHGRGPRRRHSHRGNGTNDLESRWQPNPAVLIFSSSCWLRRTKCWKSKRFAGPHGYECSTRRVMKSTAGDPYFVAACGRTREYQARRRVPRETEWSPRSAKQLSRT